MKELNVSVIITCYNQAAFLPEAVQSAIDQTYPPYEIIIIDDGSEDHTLQVAIKYPDVRYIHQTNQGLSAARNTGLKNSKGNYVVFLDSDDRLLPGAIEAGLNAFKLTPHAGFVSGHFRYISEDGSIKFEYPQIVIEKDHYKAFLKSNYIGMHAAVMYHKDSLEKIGGFDTTLGACEDYDVYLKISKVLTVSCHKNIIAEYRQHSENMSGDNNLMLASVLQVLNSQLKFVKSEKELKKALKCGKREWILYYGSRLLQESLRLYRQGHIVNGARMMMRLLRYSPTMLF